MAYLDFLLNDEQRRAQQAALSPAAPPPAGGASPGGGSAAPASVGAPAEGGPNRAGGGGTGWVNFGDFLAQNAAPAQEMGQRIAGGLNTRGAAVESGLTNMQGAYTQAARAGQTQAPTLAEYGGANFTALEREGQDVAGRARTLQSGGLGTLLADEYGRGRGYSSGEQTWDAALAGQGGAAKELRAAGGRWGGLDSALATRGQGTAPALPMRDMPGLDTRTPGPNPAEDPRQRRRDAIERRLGRGP